MTRKLLETDHFTTDFTDSGVKRKEVQMKDLLEFLYIPAALNFNSYALLDHPEDSSIFIMSIKLK